MRSSAINLAGVLALVIIVAACSSESDLSLDEGSSPSSTIDLPEESATTESEVATTTTKVRSTSTASSTTTEPPTTTQGRPRGYISASLFDEPWPFTVQEGVVRCVDGSAVVFDADDTTYAINGLARGRAKDEGWSEVEPIWLENPSIPGTRINIGPVIDHGLDLCE